MSHLVSLAEIHGRQLVAWLATMNEWAFTLFVAALVLDHILARRVRASWRIALYAPLALRVLLPESWTFSMARAPRVMTMLTPVPVDLPPAPEMVGAAPSLGWPAAAVAVYLGVALLLACAIARRRASARGVLLASRPVTRELAGFRLPCPVVEHVEAGPMVVGLISPSIVVPTQILFAGDPLTLASILRHESAHITRRDPWLVAAIQLALVALWPVVPMWAASWRVRQLMEIACDESALASASPSERRQYGHALLDFAAVGSAVLTPMSAHLHFGSTLRARVEALTWTRRWPVALQVGLVAGVAAGFGACSSVAPGPQGSELSTPRRRDTPASWTPPPAGEPLWGSSEETRGAPVLSIEKYCGPFIARVRGSLQRSPAPLLHVLRVGANPPDAWEAAWMSVPTDGLPDEQVSFCRSARGVELARVGWWSGEARDALGQIGKDSVAAFEQRRSRGDATLCPSGPPVPKVAPAANAVYTPHWPEDWKDGAGFECLDFSMSAPFSFQYRMDDDPTHLAATAHAERTIEGHLVDVTMVLRGEVRGRELVIAPYLEETWRVVD